MTETEEDGRAGHLAWCRQRALEYADAGNLGDAAASLVSDLGKHEDTRGVATKDFLEAITIAALMDDQAGMRALILSLA